MKLFIIGSTPCKSESPGHLLERKRLTEACFTIGRSIAAAQHDVAVCSPFADSADFDILKGISSSPNADEITIDFNFVDTPSVRKALETTITELQLKKVNRIPHEPPRQIDEQGMRYAWLLCQLRALESSHATIAIGGNPDGAANMLLQLADGNRKPLLPLPFMGGAALFAYERRKYELEDYLSEDIKLLQDENAVGKIIPLISKLKSRKLSKITSSHSKRSPKFFISYSRARQAEADHVETLLRRRNLTVTRDESDFGAGHSIPANIRDSIHQCDIFIAMWCQEYACSPWCFDELELALDRHEAAKIRLWIFRTDETRIVPKRARDLNSFSVKSRQELEGRIIELLSRDLNQD